MKNQKFFNPSGKEISTTEDFIYCSSDVWAIWGYPSEEILILTAINGLATWNELSSESPYCFSTAKDKNVFYFNACFGVMLMKISERVNLFYQQQNCTQLDHLYFIQDAVTKNIKIGRSKNPESRLKSLQIGSSNLLNLLKIVENAGQTEKQIHSQFKKNHLHGEWFKCSPALIKYIKEI